MHCQKINLNIRYFSVLRKTLYQKCMMFNIHNYCLYILLFIILAVENFDHTTATNGLTSAFNRTRRLVEGWQCQQVQQEIRTIKTIV